jgi:hypothetical protein
MEKAYAKLHGNYERITKINTLDVLVDLTGGLSEKVDLQHQGDKKDPNLLWQTFYGFYQQKFLLSSINSV